MTTFKRHRGYLTIEPPKQTLSGNLARRMKKFKFSQRTLSECSGVHQSTICRILSGKIERPSRETIDKLAAGLVTTYTGLMRGVK